GRRAPLAKPRAQCPVTGPAARQERSRDGRRPLSQPAWTMTSHAGRSGRLRTIDCSWAIRTGLAISRGRHGERRLRTSLNSDLLASAIFAGSFSARRAFEPLPPGRILAMTGAGKERTGEQEVHGRSTRTRAASPPRTPNGTG